MVVTVPVTPLTTEELCLITPRGARYKVVLCLGYCVGCDTGISIAGGCGRRQCVALVSATWVHALS